MAVLADLYRRSVRDSLTGCLRWTGAHNENGYGQIVLEGKTQSVHRASYKATFGPVPEGLEVDHVASRGCRYRDCIEPSHLEAVTHAENIDRRRTVTHCPQGHEYSVENTQLTRGRRHCRICKRAWHKEYMRKRRAAERQQKEKQHG